MAHMIPDSLPRRASKGEERVYQALQRLPDDYLVYYEPVVGQRYPDFVVLAPDLGVLVVEIKGWRPGDFIAGDGHDVTVKDRDAGPKKERHPLRQAREYQLALQDACRQSREASALLHADGERQGQFLFPFGHCAVLSNIDERQLRQHASGDLTTQGIIMGWPLLTMLGPLAADAGTGMSLVEAAAGNSTVNS